MYLFVRYFMYLRDFDLAQKQQVESPVNILGVPCPIHSRAPLTYKGSEHLLLYAI
jgi:hypothetical protein